jgi:hypothetical protein
MSNSFESQAMQSVPDTAAKPQREPSETFKRALAAIQEINQSPPRTTEVVERGPGYMIIR